MKAVLVRFVIVLLAATLSMSAGTLLTLNCIPTAEPGACVPDIATQVAIDLSDAGGTHVDFTFFNSGPIISGISDIYFDLRNGIVFLSMINIAESAGVDFANPTMSNSGSNFPRGSSVVPPFATSWHIHNVPALANAIDVGESLTVRVPGVFDTILEAVLKGDVRVGLHLQAIASAGVDDLTRGDSYLTSSPLAPVPEPATLALMGTGLLLFGLAKRRDN